MMNKITILAAALMLSGCSTLNAVGDGFYRWEHNAATPASHGTHQLVKAWYGQPYDKTATWERAPRPHYCQYDNGIIMEAGTQLCPYTL
jgi:hypothetical protein